ncbi:unnamed protein product, partial [Meganyctiphanes norvegica]
DDGVDVQDLMDSSFHGDFFQEVDFSTILPRPLDFADDNDSFQLNPPQVQEQQDDVRDAQEPRDPIIFTPVLTEPLNPADDAYDLYNTDFDEYATYDDYDFTATFADHDLTDTVDDDDLTATVEDDEYDDYDYLTDTGFPERTNCEDKAQDCDIRECNTSPNVSYVECAKTCGTCLPQSLEECVDLANTENCYLGSLLGMCTRNPSWYLPYCSHSCRQFIELCSLPKRNLIG